MLYSDLDYKLSGYDNVPRRKQNKAMTADIKVIASERAFKETMWRLGITQSNKQFAELVTDEEYFNKNRNRFKERNSFKLVKEKVIYFDDKEQKEFKVPHGKTVIVYTKEYRGGWGWRSSRKMLEVAYVVDGELYVINKQEEEEV